METKIKGVTITSNKLVMKDELLGKIYNLEDALKTVRQDFPDDFEAGITDCMKQIRKLAEEKSIIKCTSRGKTTLQEKDNTEDFEVDVEISEFFAATDDDTEDDLKDYALDYFDDDDLFDYLEGKGYEGCKPLIAEDLNDYDFRRKVCDMFQTAYTVSNDVLIKHFLQRIDKDFLILL